MFGRYLIAGALALVVVYGIMEAGPLLSGPTLVVDSPKEGAAIEGGVVSIEGHVTHAVTLTLNGNRLLASSDGAFHKKLAFPRGSSILTFTATDRFGRDVTETRTIYVP